MEGTYSHLEIRTICVLFMFMLAVVCVFGDESSKLIEQRMVRDNAPLLQKNHFRSSSEVQAERKNGTIFKYVDDGVLSTVEISGTGALFSCGSPEPAVDGAAVNVTGTLPGDKAHYSCLHGYELVAGNLSRTCQQNKQWSGLSPMCRKVSCAIPTGIKNGEESYTGLEFEDKVTYQCNKGYEMIGDKELTCMADKTWSGVKPRCQKVSCAKPPGINNGKRRYTGLEFEGKVKYQCDIGYEMIGDEELTCMADKNWSGVMPRCQIKSCGDPTDDASVYRKKYTGFHYGDTIGYECMHGYTAMKGQALLTCNADGKWDRNSPKCTERYCEHPPATVDQTITEEARSIVRYGDKIGITAISYKCNPNNFTGCRFLTGREVLRCTNGNWDGHPPHCTKGCFPSNGEVWVNRTGTVVAIPLSQLRKGDYVKGMNTNHQEEFLKVVGFKNFDENSQQTYFQLTTADGKTITATKGHNIYVQNTNQKVSKNRIAIEKIQVGQFVFASNSYGQMDTVQVTKITQVSEKGLISPITEGECSMFINGILASCHAGKLP